MTRIPRDSARILFANLIAALCLGGAAWAGSVPAGWELVWADEFDVDGPPNPENWTYDLGAGGWGNNEVQTYTDDPENVRVEDGRLIIEVHQITDGRTPRYTSARLVTHGLHAWQYGRFEIRARVPRTTGTWPAIWMLSEDSIFPGAFWPDNGEIDIMEHVGYELDPLFHEVYGGLPPNIHGTLHTKFRNGMPTTGSPIGSSILLPTASDEFHTYTLVWTEEGMEMDVDGQVYFSITKESLIPARNPPPPEEIFEIWPFDQPFHLLLNVAVGGSWGGHFNSEFYPGISPYGIDGIDHEGEWPQRMEVEYVRVYAPADSAMEWRGWPLSASGYADTGDWLGMLYVMEDPWVYSPAMGWIYLPETTEPQAGEWGWIPRPAAE